MDYRNIIWHYTSFDTAIKILTSQVLRATNVLFTNDSTEYNYAWEIIHRSLEQIKEKDLLDPETYTLMEDYLNHSKELIDRSSPYISCFCDHHPDDHLNLTGLLSMWRSYSSNNGVAIGFNRVKLEEVFKNDPRKSILSSFGKTIYVPDIYKLNPEKKQEDKHNDWELQQNKYFQTLMAHANDGAPIMLYDRKQQPYSWAECIVNILASYKHIGFEEEREYRFFCCPHDKLDLNLVQYDKLIEIKIDGDRPYIELFASQETLPIESIIIGPSLHQAGIAQFIENKIKETNPLDSIDVICSSTPYRMV